MAAVITMIKKDTILILYPPGSYGTFLEWSLLYFSGLLENTKLPFRATGSAHEYKGNHLDIYQPDFLNISSIDYFSSNSNLAVVRTHIFNDPTKIQATVDKFKNYSKLIVSLVPDSKSQLLVLNNAISKLSDVNRELLKKGLYVVTDIDQEDPVWVKREKLSFIYSWYNNFDDYRPTEDNVYKLSVTDFLNDFETNIQNILDKSQLNIDSDRFKNITDIKNQWLGLQEFKNRQSLCENIVALTLQNVFYEWTGTALSIYDEAYIQYMFRVLHNYDIRCYNLVVFPTNTFELRKLLHAKSI